MPSLFNLRAHANNFTGPIPGSFSKTNLYTSLFRNLTLFSNPYLSANLSDSICTAQPGGYCNIQDIQTCAGSGVSCGGCIISTCPSGISPSSGVLVGSASSNIQSSTLAAAGSSIIQSSTFAGAASSNIRSIAPAATASSIVQSTTLAGSASINKITNTLLLTPSMQSTSSIIQTLDSASPANTIPSAKQSRNNQNSVAIIVSSSIVGLLTCISGYFLYRLYKRRQLSKLDSVVSMQSLRPRNDPSSMIAHRLSKSEAESQMYRRSDNMSVDSTNYADYVRNLTDMYNSTSMLLSPTIINKDFNFSNRTSSMASKSSGNLNSRYEMGDATVISNNSDTKFRLKNPEIFRSDFTFSNDSSIA